MVAPYNGGTYKRKSANNNHKGYQIVVNSSKLILPLRFIALACPFDLEPFLVVFSLFL